MFSGNDGKSQSLFFHAVSSSNEEVVKQLIENADLHEVNQKGFNVLALADTLPILNLILQKAEQQKNLNQLLSMLSIDGDTMLEEIAASQKLIILQRLLAIENWHHCVDLSTFLSRVRLASWCHSSDFKKWDDICQTTKQLMTASVVKEFNINQDSVRESIITCHKNLFGKKCDLTTPQNKEAAVKYVLAQVQSLLSDPRRCLKYLRFLNNEFNRYLVETGEYLLTTPPSNYTFKAINDLWYPIPHEQFIGQTKHNALDKFLIALFQQHGLQAQSYQWVGYIPHEKANPMVINDYVKENRYGVALLHGTISHALQQAIFIYAIEGDDIDTSYEENGIKKNVSLHEMQQAFVTLKRHNSTDNVWMAIRDNRDIANPRFTDPHRLSSMIMQQGEALGLSTLSRHMIDSFCKSFKKWLAAHCEHIRHTEMNEFIAQLNELQLHTFPVPSQMIRHAIREHQNKTRYISQGQHSDKQEYAVVVLNYALNHPEFKVKGYTHDHDAYLPKGLAKSIYQLRAWLQKTGRNFSDVFDTAYFTYENLKTMEKSNSRNKNYEIFCDYIVNRLKASTFSFNCTLLILFNILRSPHWLDSTFSGSHDDNDLDTFIKIFCSKMKINIALVKIYDCHQSIQYNILQYYLAQASNDILFYYQNLVLDYVSNHTLSLAWSKHGLILKSPDETSSEEIIVYNLGKENFISILKLVESDDEKRCAFYIDCINKLIQNSTDDKKRGYLLNAFKNEDNTFVKRLLNEGADANQLCFDLIKGDPSSPLLSWPILQEDTELLLHFIAQPNMVINMRDEEGYTALYENILDNCNLRFIRFLLEYGADANLGRYDNKGNPLLSAIQSGNMELFDLLFEFKINPNPIFDANLSVITRSIIKDVNTITEFVNYLKIKMAIDNLPETLTLTSLQFAIICNRTNMVKKLLDYSAKLATDQNNIDVFELTNILKHNDIKETLTQHMQKQSYTTITPSGLSMFENQENMLGDSEWRNHQGKRKWVQKLL